MPRHTTVDCPANTWTLLTTNDVASLRATNMGAEAIWLQATATATPPAALPAGALGALPLHPNETLAGDLPLLELFPGVAGAARVYAFVARATRVSVSHA